MKVNFGQLASQKFSSDQQNMGNMTDHQNPCTERTIHLSDPSQKIHIGPLDSSRTQVKGNAALTSSFVQSSVDTTMDDDAAFDAKL